VKIMALKYVHMTEKSISVVEKQNKIVFIVDRKSTKKDIKNEIENEFKVKVDSVNTLVDQKGRKKAIVRLNKKYPAIDIATRLGMI